MTTPTPLSLISYIGEAQLMFGKLQFSKQSEGGDVGWSSGVTATPFNFWKTLYFCILTNVCPSSLDSTYNWDQLSHIRGVVFRICKVVYHIWGTVDQIWSFSDESKLLFKEKFLLKYVFALKEGFIIFINQTSKDQWNYAIFHSQATCEYHARY